MFLIVCAFKYPILLCIARIVLDCLCVQIPYLTLHCKHLRVYIMAFPCMYQANLHCANQEKCLERKKKRYLAKFEAHMHCLFLGQQNKRAWKLYNKRQLIHNSSHLRCGVNMQVLYDITEVLPLIYPHSSCPCESTFFTPENVRNTIAQLQLGRTQDHDGLVDEHLSLSVKPCCVC